jgi:uncharacterized membrane protein
MLIVFPLGMFASAVIFDIVYLINGNVIFNTISFYNIIIGIIGGLIAALFGFIDYLNIPRDTRAKSIGTLHGLGNVLIVVLFLISLLIRNASPTHTPDTLALILSFAGIILALFTGWLGGELVDRLAVGVDRGANLNAPNSLTGEPANPRVAAVPVTGPEPHDHPEEGDVTPEIPSPEDDFLDRDRPDMHA